jgi:hypothetical protein
VQREFIKHIDFERNVLRVERGFVVRLFAFSHIRETLMSRVKGEITEELFRRDWVLMFLRNLSVTNYQDGSVDRS